MKVDDPVNVDTNMPARPAHPSPGAKPDSAPDRHRNGTQPPFDKGRKVRLLITGILAAAVVVTFGVRWWIHSRTWSETDNAYVAGHVHQISSRVAGTVAEVLVDDNQAVKTGQVLLKLDPSDFEVQVNQSEAKLTSAQSQVQQADAALEAARSQVTQAESQTAAENSRVTQAQALQEKAAADFQRAEKLKGTGAISAQEFDTAKAARDGANAALETAQASLRAAQAQHKTALVQIRTSEAALAVAKATELAAQAVLREARLQLSYTTVKAPSDGWIGRKSVETGNRLSTGQPIMAVVQPDKWVVANFKETQLANMKIGQAVELSLDAFPGVVFHGIVNSFSPASGAQFALLPPDNATGNFTKIVQRVPVKILFDANSLQGLQDRIAPGMSAVVKVKVRE